MNKFLNFVSFQLTWFACILGAATHHELLGILIGIIGVIFNLRQSRQFRSELTLLFKGVTLGIFVDTMLIHLDLISFQTDFWKFISPVWMWVIWASLMTTLNSSMSWLKDRLVLSALLGAIMGALSYYAGVKLGAGYFQNINYSLLAIGVIWLLLTPMLLKLTPDVRLT